MEPAILFLVVLMIWHFVGLLPMFVIQGIDPKDFKTRTRFILYLFLIGPVSSVSVFTFWIVDYLRNTEFKLVNKIRDFFLDG